MFSSISGLVFQSLLLAGVLTVLSWAAVGAALASRSCRSPVLGALLSGLLPLVGWPLVWLLPRRADRAADVRPGAPHRFLAVLGVLGGLVLLLGLWRPWVRVTAQRLLDEDYSGTTSAFTAVPVAVAATVLIAGSVAFALRPRGSAVVPALFTSTGCVLVGAQLLLVTGASGEVVRRFAPVTGTGAAVSGGQGAVLLLVGGLLGTLWALAALATLLAQRRTAGGAAGLPHPTPFLGERDVPGRASW